MIPEENYRIVTCCSTCHSVRHIGGLSAILNGFNYDKPSIMCGACGTVTKYYDQKQVKVRKSLLKPSAWFDVKWRDV